MSVLSLPVFGAQEDYTGAKRNRGAKLRVVPALAAQVSQRLYWGALVAIVIIGTSLLLMLNVTLQNQAFELRTLEAEQQVLVNQEAALEQQLTERSSSAALAQEAIDLGMVPATSPGFVLLPDGTLVGDPQPVTGAGPYAGLKSVTQPTEQPAPAEESAVPAEEAAAAGEQPAADGQPVEQPAADASGQPVAETPAAPAEQPVKVPAVQQEPTGTAEPNASSQEG